MLNHCFDLYMQKGEIVTCYSSISDVTLTDSQTTKVHHVRSQKQEEYQVKVTWQDSQLLRQDKIN